MAVVKGGQLIDYLSEPIGRIRLFAIAKQKGSNESWVYGGDEVEKCREESARRRVSQTLSQGMRWTCREKDCHEPPGQQAVTSRQSDPPIEVVFTLQSSNDKSHPYAGEDPSVGGHLRNENVQRSLSDEEEA